MKLIALMILITTSSLTIASEVSTDCLAINQSRAKEIKSVKSNMSGKKRSSRQ